jgi:hypothetical protein
MALIRITVKIRPASGLVIRADIQHLNQMVVKKTLLIIFLLTSVLAMAQKADYPIQVVHKSEVE